MRNYISRCYFFPHSFIISKYSLILPGFSTPRPCLVKREEDSHEDEITIDESLQFNFDTIRVATNEFDDSNKLGEGGFGAVYSVR